jgi:hypothetical protein
VPNEDEIAVYERFLPVSVFFDEKLGGSQHGGAVFAILDTAYSFRLVTAFTKILDRRIQQRIVELVEQVADKNSAVGAAGLTALDRHVGARVRGRRLEKEGCRGVEMHY